MSGRPRFEVADVVRACSNAFRLAHHPSGAQEAVLRHIADCRTAALGGHVDECSSCGLQRISYNSCRDRHCPKCQSLARAGWLEARLQRLLPVPYFHVVFTIPDDLNALALGNKRLVFDCLFNAAAQTLKTIAKDEKHLGADIGFTAVLHTWGQNILFHPHLHCVVTGGGLSSDGTRWVKGRQRFFLPVRVLASLFRGKLLAALETARTTGKLHFGGSTAELAHDVAWNQFRDRLYRKDWVVYAKPPFGGPGQVFAYLGRYTHRVAISNHRITNFDNGLVSFAFKDYADGCHRKTMTVGALEFLRRFLLHVLPQGFTRIRHFGLLAGRNVTTKLEHSRKLLSPAGAPTLLSADDPQLKRPWSELLLQRTGIDVMACPNCAGRFSRTFEIAPSSRWIHATGTDPPFTDTS